MKNVLVMLVAALLTLVLGGGGGGGAPVASVLNGVPATGTIQRLNWTGC
jgi:hypothetical protein